MGNYKRGGGGSRLPPIDDWMRDRNGGVFKFAIMGV